MTKSIRFREALGRIGIKAVTGYKLVAHARDADRRADGDYLDTFCIGRFRYVTEEELRRFVEVKLAVERSQAARPSIKVRKALEARARNRKTGTARSRADRNGTLPQKLRYWSSQLGHPKLREYGSQIQKIMNEAADLLEKK